MLSVVKQRVFEGFLLKFGGGIWVVKGCDHPEGYAVAIPRLIGGVKLKRVKEAIEVVRKRFPNVLKYYDKVGFQVPLVPLDESEIINPFKIEPRDNVSAKFSSFFQNNVGITGSMAYSNSWRDMDFLSTDLKHLQTLRRLREEGITKPLSSYYQEEVETLDSKSFFTLKRRRVSEGTFMNVDYTFKIVECINFSPVIGSSKFEGKVNIIESIKSVSLPVIYKGIDEHGIEIFLTSFRTRFTEMDSRTSLYVNGYLFRREGNFLDLDLDVAETVTLL